MMRTLGSALVSVMILGCATGPDTRPVSQSERAAATVLDDWHAAAAASDSRRYLHHLASDAVFIGTDATERWTRPVFAAYVAKHFSRGKGWTMRVKRRHLRGARSGGVVSFDEELIHAKYGPLRGSGVLEWRAGRWQIVHYVLSFPIPNKLAGRVIKLLRETQ